MQLNKRDVPILWDGMGRGVRVPNPGGAGGSVGQGRSGNEEPMEQAWCG